MRKIIFYFLLFAFYSCIPYKSYQKTDTICEVGMNFQEYEKTFDKKLNPKRGEWQEVDSGSFSVSYAIGNTFMIMDNLKIGHLHLLIQSNNLLG